MTATEAISYVRNFCLTAGESTYSAQKVAQAIMTVGDDFVAMTRATRTKSQITLSDGVYEIGSFPDSMEDFAPEQAMEAWIDGSYPVKIVDFHEIVDRRAGGDQSAQPRLIAFDSATTAALWPTPDQAYTLDLFWWAPFTSWSTSSGDSDTTYETVTLNLPDRYMRNVLVLGVTGMLQKPEPQYADLAEARYKEYVKWRDVLRGGGNLGAKSVRRRLPGE